jgi:hypothetical protein
MSTGMSTTTQQQGCLRLHLRPFEICTSPGCNCRVWPSVTRAKHTRRRAVRVPLYSRHVCFSTVCFEA